MKLAKVTPLEGMTYYYPQPGASVEACDGFVKINYDDIPVPLLDEDYNKLEECLNPDYDMLGRGIYEALRRNPDMPQAPRYAALLKEGYPHFLSELGSLIIMIDSKDVDPSYLDRKINYLKIFTLIEPENHRLHYEIALTYHKKGVSLDALHQISGSFFKAEEHLEKARKMSPEDRDIDSLLAEVSYILGRYEKSVQLWGGIAEALESEKRAKLDYMVESIQKGETPFVPVVDYLEAAAVAFSYYERNDFEEAAAIVNDILKDSGFVNGYPMAELWYLLGSCHKSLSLPVPAESAFRRALDIRFDYPEAQAALDSIRK